MYALGIDLGTTYTAAATWRDGHAEIASLGSKAAVIPSVVLLRADETVLTGEAASRRGLTEPVRVAREFKRRFGDTTPILLGGTPYSPEALTAKLLRAVVDDVAAREGGQPTHVCISHPANWGPYKRDLLHQVARLANLEMPVAFTTEPEAAAVFYAHQQRVDPGALVAVYDLGGGTFDATVLRKTSSGFELLGHPEGIERLGGIDFDAAVFHHVSEALDGKLAELDEDDPAVVAAVGRLRDECIEAKEALSSDTDAVIPVLLPNLSTEVRLTRAEFEAMVRPTLHSTIEAMRRALRSAGVEPQHLHSVLLVGGSSRIPLVSQLVGAELGRPVAVDAHPKHAVALGAAWLASGARPGRGDAVPARGTTGAAVATATGAAAGAAARAATGAGTGNGIGGQPRNAGHRGTPPTPQRDASPRLPDGTTEGRTEGQLTELFTPVPPRPTPPSKKSEETPGRGRSPWPMLATIGVVVIALVGGSIWWAMTRETTPPGGNEGTTSPPETTQQQVPADEQCTDEIMGNERWACLSRATFDGETLTIEYDGDWAGSTPNRSDGFHLHLYGGDGSEPPAEIMGSHAPQGERGSWVIEDRASPLVYPVGDGRDSLIDKVRDTEKVCVRIANSSHQLVPDADGRYHTGNCVPIER